ncbi:hypothetical protein ANN_08521 [Periplaneta americana]|uniref:Uncharacterized protein n=1 Tax=Periplaneta americana TaxID=6978 RepID=A0ABQ8T1M7_PERAM|nr:hypothetical protein ANN_08521 [Periplaneta americana]
MQLGQERTISKETGDGPPGSPITTIEENVIVVLGDSAEPLKNPYDDEGGYAEIPIPVKETLTLDIPVLCLPELNDTAAMNPSPQTPQVKSNKRRSQEVDEVDEMMREIHAKQLCVLDLQERKALLEICLIEKDILKKGYELLEWHTRN